MELGLNNPADPNLTTRERAQRRDSAEEPPLVVDLDGTLVRGDLLLECMNQFVKAHPFALHRPLLWLLRGGRAHLKARLAEATTCDVTLLPYNQQVVAWLQREKSAGRRIVLATASHASLARAVARHLAIFDEVIATDQTTNLKADAKRDALTARYGEKGFDYVGNESADIPVWSACRRAFLADPGRGVEQRARAVAEIGGVLHNPRRPLYQTVARALRIHQWLKNLLIFVPLVTAHRFTSAIDIAAACYAFACFSVCASSVYILNDLVDVESDRSNARKSRRPFAAGELSLLTGWLLAPVLLAAAVLAATWLLPWTFVAVLGVYYTLTVAYSFGVKKIAMLDVVTLALLYTVRIIAGAAAVQVPLSFWLLAISLFLFTSLALVKRYTELEAADPSMRDAPVSGRGYWPGDRHILAPLGACSGLLSVLVLALYIQDPATTRLYASPEIIWFACPLLLYWIGRTWLIAHRGAMHEDPVVFAAKDRVSWIVVVLFGAILGLAR